jgi:hypothetical protein
LILFAVPARITAEWQLCNLLTDPQNFKCSSNAHLSISYSTTTTTFAPLSMKLGGSATQALERFLKRQRIVSSNMHTVLALETAFNLDQVFSSLNSPEYESFPSLCWDFDDEPQTKSESETFSVNPPSMGWSRKRDREGVALGLVRSKSLKQGLSSLTASNVPVQAKPLPQNMTDFIAERLKLSSASKDFSLWRTSRFEPSSLLNVDIAKSRGLYPCTA